MKIENKKPNLDRARETFYLLDAKLTAEVFYNTDGVEITIDLTNDQLILKGRKDLETLIDELNELENYLLYDREIE